MSEHCSPYQDLQPEEPPRPTKITAEMIDECVVVIMGGYGIPLKKETSPVGYQRHWAQCREMANMLNQKMGLV